VVAAVGVLAGGAVLLLALWVLERTELASLRLAKLLGRVKPQAAELAPEETAGALASVFKVVLGWASRLGARFFPVARAAELEEKLLQAGRPWGLGAEGFYSLKLAAGALGGAVLGGIGFLGSGAGGLLLLAAGALGGYMLPDLYAGHLVESRRRKVEGQLFSFCDLLALCCEAGLALGEAVRRVAEKMPGLLSELFTHAVREVELGRPRQEAFAAMARQVASEELKLLVTALVEAEKTGTPVAQVLRDQSREIRRVRRMRAAEFAQKASVKMLLPVMAFMFLPMLVLLLGPALLNLSRVFGL
jgi:tight adherence protein C